MWQQPPSHVPTTHSLPFVKQSLDCLHAVALSAQCPPPAPVELEDASLLEVDDVAAPPLPPSTR
jgi:hypothetical protein